SAAPHRLCRAMVRLCAGSHRHLHSAGLSQIATGTRMTTLDSPHAPAGRGRSQALLLIGFFLLPLAFAFILYYGLDGWRPAGSTNKGELIQPARPLPEFTL